MASRSFGGLPSGCKTHEKGGKAINAKQELAGRLMMLVYDEAVPDTQHVLDMLADYRIDHTLGIEQMDFMRQVNHFLNAKKSEGMTQVSIYGYRIHLNIFYNYINKAAANVTSRSQAYLRDAYAKLRNGYYRYTKAYGPCHCGNDRNLYRAFGGKRIA